MHKISWLVEVINFDYSILCIFLCVAHKTYSSISAHKSAPRPRKTFVKCNTARTLLLVPCLFFSNCSSFVISCFSYQYWSNIGQEAARGSSKEEGFVLLSLPAQIIMAGNDFWLCCQETRGSGSHPDGPGSIERWMVQLGLPFLFLFYPAHGWCHSHPGMVPWSHLSLSKHFYRHAKWWGSPISLALLIQSSTEEPVLTTVVIGNVLNIKKK